MLNVRMSGVLGAVLLAGCAAAPQGSGQGQVTVIARGAEISGANGMHAGPDGLLYVASVLGSEILAIDPDSGAVQRRLTAADGVAGPDDIAFAPDGAFYWTSILTGEVTGFDAGGQRVVAARLTPGVNPITFADDGRLFVAQCFFDDNLYEVDPRGVAAPRLIADDLGPGCGLNGMDWGPDDRLYGPRWFHGEVVRFNVDTGARELVADGFNVPAAVKFDSRGRLHVLDTGTGEIWRLAEQGRERIATLAPGLDNLAFDAQDRLFVSSFTDGFVAEVLADGTTRQVLPGGMAHPGGVTTFVRDGQPAIVVADMHSLRAFHPETGELLFIQRNVLGVGELGSVLSVKAAGNLLVLTAFTENSVRIWDPATESTVARWDDLQQPVSALLYGDGVAVAEHGSGRVLLLREDGTEILAQGLVAPTGLATDGNSLYLTDRTRGQVLRIAAEGAAIVPELVAGGLAAPEGIAVDGQTLLVLEGESGRVLRIADTVVTEVAKLPPGSPPAADIWPPAMILNDLTVHEGRLYVTGERERVLYRITP